MLALAVTGCVRRPPPAAPGAHYVVGQGYQRAGTWFYPHEDFHYAATGLAMVQADRAGVTADGEAIDPAALNAAHQTLQLPAVVLVTNLETGLQVRVRVNDRGPDTPARLIALSRRAGQLLGIQGTAAVRVEVDEAMSLALRQQLNGGPTLALTAAPRAAVTAEALAPPPGIGQSTRASRTGATPPASTASAASGPQVPDRLPETVSRVAPVPVSLMITAGTFGQAGYARQVAARLANMGARVERTRDGRSERFSVRAGPFASVAAADMALDQALSAGVTDARIVVE